MLASALLTPVCLLSLHAAAQDLPALDRQFQSYWKEGKYKEAQTVAERMLKVAEADPNTSAHNLAGCLANLADVYCALAKYQQALPLHERAMVIRQRAFGRDHLETANSHNNLADVQRHLGKSKEAEENFHRTLEIRRLRLPADHADIASAYANLALIHTETGKYSQAEEEYARALAMYRRTLPADDLVTVNAVNSFGNLLVEQGRYAEAQEQFQWVLAVRERKLKDEHPDVATCLHNLGVVLLRQGRLADSEPLLKRALTIRQVALHPDHPHVADTLNALGILYSDQGRLEDAEKRYQRALAIYELKYGVGHGSTAHILHNLALVQKRLRRFDTAEPALRKSLEAAQKAHSADHPEVATHAMNLAGVLLNLKRHDEAEVLFRQAESILRKTLPSGHPDLGDLLHNFADLRIAQSRMPDAEKMLTEAVAIHSLGAASPQQLFKAYELRSRVRSQQGQFAEAIHDLRDAVALAESQRSLVAGHEADRATAFVEYLPAFEQWMLLERQQGNLESAWLAMERARARSLIDQLQLQGVDLLAGAPAEQVAALKRRQAANQQRLAELEKQWQQLPGVGAPANEREEKAAALLAELAKNREEAVEIHRDIRAASPACRLSVGQQLTPLSLAAARAWVDPQQALLLAYQMGRQGIHVFVIGAKQPPRLVTLTASPERAAALGIPQGADAAAGLPELLSQEITEVMILLSRPESAAKAARRLEALWELLVPPEERQDMLQGKYQCLIVVPDGPLAWLPWEALVPQRGEQPEYLLDRGPAVFYGPSATVLHNLSLRPKNGVSRIGERAAILLTVGNPAYAVATPESNNQDGRGAPVTFAPRSRFFLAGSQLSPLPHSGLESHWVAEVFRENGVGAKRLVEREATEAAVRANLPAKKFIHLACHGLVDQTYGNLFGALAFAPGRGQATDSADDGFLTLGELYTLNLAGCELAMLSACQTNYGPQQRGEGVWGLSRGFLVAGARRTVASNWLVDDEAAAALMSQFAREIAAAEKSGQAPDYAGALQRAKQWVRKQEKWRSPYFWAPFVLIGPN